MIDTPAESNEPTDEIFPDERLNTGEREQRRAEYRRMGPVGFWRWWIREEETLSFKEWIVARTYREWVFSVCPGDLPSGFDALAADWFTMEPESLPAWDYTYEDRNARYQGVYRIGCFKVDGLMHADGQPTNCRRVVVIHGDAMWEKHPAMFFDSDGPGTWQSYNEYPGWPDGECFARSMLSDLLSYRDHQRQHRIDFIEIF